MKLIEELKKERAARHAAGEDWSLGAAIRAVCKRHNLCPDCKLGRGRRWLSMTDQFLICVTCQGKGRWLPEHEDWRMEGHEFVETQED
jgi:hypothetical protein